MKSSVIAIRKPLEELLRRIRDRHEGYSGFTISPTDRLCHEIASETWSAMEDFCNFLKQFKDATSLMSASIYPTLGMVLPVIHQLSRHVERTIKATDGFRSVHAIKFSQAVQEKLDEYEPIVLSREVTIAAALDPRVKPYLQHFGVSMSQVRIWITTEYVQNYESK